MPFDFSAVTTPFRIQPGLRRLVPGAIQLTPLREGDRALREKLAVLSAGASQALGCASGFDAMPALHALCRHAAMEHPADFGWDGARASAYRLGWSVVDDEPVPLAAALPDVGHCLLGLPRGWRLGGLLALAFHEDFAVIEANAGCIPWLAVCLPSRWAPEEKIGRHFSEIHAPVADNAILIAAGAHLMRLVTAPERWERFVWTITPHPRLDAHPARSTDAAWPDAASPAELAALAFWRTERQTFIPVAGHSQAVFTIQIEVRPLASAVSAPVQAAAVRAALASMSPAVLAYRGLAPARDRLLRWLDAPSGA